MPDTATTEALAERSSLVRINQQISRLLPRQLHTVQRNSEFKIFYL
jgi:hypothetical protein